MSFFFTQHALEAKRNGQHKGLRNAALTKQNAATLNRLGCAACPLNGADVDTPKMQPTLAKNTKVYFLAEAPGRHEDETSGRPLTGPSGALLRECIPRGQEAYCSFDNTVRDRPPDNRTPTWQEIECCRNNVIRSIETAKPKLVVGLGKIPLNWALGNTDLPGMRGRIFTLQVGGHQCWFLPTYHPSFILRTAYNKDKPLQSRLGHCFKMDLKLAFRLVDELPPAKVDAEADVRVGIQCFDGSGGYDDLIRLLQRTSKAPIKAIDLETSCLRPYATNARLLTCAFSFDDVNFSFAIDHPKAKWSKDQKNKILFYLRVILLDEGIKVAHNAPFEIEWLIHYCGEQIVKHHVWECTQMQAHFLDERRGKQHNEDEHRAAYQNLDFLIKQHFGIAYKSLFKLNKKDMANADLNETLTYNGVDAKYTLKLWHKQNALLKKQGLLAAYREALPRQPTVALMQYRGVYINQAEVKRFQEKLGGEIDTITGEIENLKVIKAYKADHGSFNPLSGPDLLVVFRDYLKRTEIYVDAKHALDFGQSAKAKKRTLDKPNETKVSLDKSVLDKIDHPLAKLITDLRNRTKLKSTYVDCFEQGVGQAIWPDGKIHTNFNTTFTETGRLSSDEPNQQNWPKRRDAWVRKQVVAPKGHSLLAFDYGQLEGCTAAVCSRDKVLVKALNEDYDIHMEWAQKIAARYPAITDKVDKQFRSFIKNKLVFPAIFGASNDSIAEYLKAPIEAVDDIMDEFWSTFTGLKAWQDKVMKDYYETGYVTSPTGRRHHYPLTRNQVINFPVQSFAAAIVCNSMNTLSEYAAQNRHWELHPLLNIHDDLTFCVPDEKVDASIEAIYKVMLTPPYDCINVPLSVEVSMGTNWHDMQDLGKYWSNKDV